jgi:hypothetical protein
MLYADSTMCRRPRCEERAYALYMGYQHYIARYQQSLEGLIACTAYTAIDPAVKSVQIEEKDGK